MKCSNVPTVAREAIKKQIEEDRKRIKEQGIEIARKWIEDEGMPQMFKAIMAMVYYTLHMRRPGKGFDSKRGIESFHKDLIQMMDENITDYDFKTDEDAIFVCNYWLKDLGVDLDKMEMPISFKINWC